MGIQKLFIGTAITTAIAFSATSFAGISQESIDNISTPNTVETTIGTLKFNDGAPLPETAQKVYDNLDTMRGVDTFLKGIPAASMHSMIKGVEGIGASEAHQIPYSGGVMGTESLFLTPNATIMYIFPTLDLERDGPTVLEIPPGMLGLLNDAYFRYMSDVGPLGPDRGKGGKFLVLPPHYDGDIPEGYFVIKSKTYRVWVPLRASMKDGLEAATKNLQDNLKIYPLAKAANPPKTELVSWSGKELNTIHSNNFHFYEELNEVVQKEPVDFINPELRGLFASVGIVKGKPFAPDARMKKILTDAVAIANATARSIVWHPRKDGTMKGVELYPGTDSSWLMGYVDKNVFFNGEDKHTMNTDARANFHYYATGVTPAMAMEIPGKGSDYALAFVDSNKQSFDGSKTYKVTLPKNIPAANFWSFTIYDSQTRSMLKLEKKASPSIDSIQDSPKQNADGSTTIFFGPKPPKGMENNWIETIPGKSWFTIFRLYGPEKEWLSKEWKLSEIEMVK